MREREREGGRDREMEREGETTAHMALCCEGQVCCSFLCSLTPSSSINTTSFCANISILIFLKSSFVFSNSPFCVLYSRLKS